MESLRFRGWLAAAIALIAMAPLGADEPEKTEPQVTVSYDGLNLFLQPDPPSKVVEKRSRMELGVFTGFIVPDKRLISTRDPGIEPTLGVRLGAGVNQRWNWFAEAQIAQFETRTFAGDADMLAARGGLEWLVEPGGRAESFFSLGWGYTHMSFDHATDFFSAFASAGVGQHVQIGGRTRLRWEVRIDRTMAPDGLRGRDLTQPQATIGFNWVLGKSKLDADRDGVPGQRDRCRDTPEGALVDARGCAMDADRDLVPDGLDACAGTPAGWTIGPDGCPIDTDGDGVADSIDACAATPMSAVIDNTGCPLDGDNDGVFDGLDRCPGTLRGIQVNEFGCFLDADEDGVYDGLGMDRCPGTPRGTKVDPFGCPIEQDDGGTRG